MTARKVTPKLIHSFWPGEIVCSPVGYEGPVKLITATHVYFGKSGPNWKGSWRYNPEKLFCLKGEPKPKFLPGMRVSDWMLGRGTIIAIDKRYAHVRFDGESANCIWADGFKGTHLVGFDNLRKLRTKAKAKRKLHDHNCSDGCMPGHFQSSRETNDAVYVCDWFRGIGYPDCGYAAEMLIKHGEWDALEDMMTCIGERVQ